MKYIYVKADVNDGDYIKQFEPLDWSDEQYELDEEGFKMLVTEEDIINLFKRFKEAIQGFQPYKTEMPPSKWDNNGDPPLIKTHYCNFPTMPRKDLGEKQVEEIYPQFTELEWDIIRDMFLPYMDNEYVHKIVDIKLLDVTELPL